MWECPLFVQHTTVDAGVDRAGSIKPIHFKDGKTEAQKCRGHPHTSIQSFTSGVQQTCRFMEPKDLVIQICIEHLLCV